MKIIVIKGKEYQKAIDLARERGYTSDYIGQLCRSGKVDAELVGRTWYVDPESLTEHKSSRYRSTNKKTLSALHHKLHDRSSVVGGVRHLTFGAYEKDDAPLFPSFTKEEPKSPKAIHVDTHEPKIHEQKLSVTSLLEKNVMMPTIQEKATFSGIVQVESLDEQPVVQLEEFTTIMPEKEVKKVRITPDVEEIETRVIISHRTKRTASSFGYNLIFFTTTVTVTVVILMVLSSVGSITTITGDQTSTSYALDFHDTASAILSVVK